MGKVDDGLQGENNAGVLVSFSFACQLPSSLRVASNGGVYTVFPVGSHGAAKLPKSSHRSRAGLVGHKCVLDMANLFVVVRQDQRMPCHPSH